MSFEIILAESTRFCVGNRFESVFVRDLSSGAEEQIAEHYGGPSCAVISPDDSWIVIGGEGLTVYRPEERVSTNFFRPKWFRRSFPPGLKLKDAWRVHAMRIDEESAVRILFDPWSEYSSVWKLRVSIKEFIKLYDGPSLVDEHYRDEVEF